VHMSIALLRNARADCV